MSLTESLQWRYATKKFDSSRKITPAILDKLKEIVSLTATSYGLETYKVLIIEDQKIKSTLKPASWNQAQVEDCSHLFVFCNYTNVSAADIDNFVSRKSDIQGIEKEKLAGYGDFMKNTIGNLSSEKLQDWTIRQTYIALGSLLIGCAEYRIDSCPMEGFDIEKYNEILKLNEQGLSAAVVAAVGYRAEDDINQHLAKVRKASEDLFLEI